jgi:hypothetical protein
LSGECEDCKAKKLQRRPLAVNEPGDRFEQEADRVSDAIVSGKDSPLTISPLTSASVQREDPPKESSDDEKYKESAKKIGEAFLETPYGKQLLEKIKQDKLVKGATDFVGTLPGIIVTGAAATGAVSALAAAHQELPVQIPEIPLDVITPGLSVKITYNGPVDKPTDASISFKLTEQAPKPPIGQKPAPSEADKFRAETARIAADQAKFRASLRYPPGSPEALRQQAEDEAVKQAAKSYVSGPNVDDIIKKYPGLKTPDRSGMQLTPPTFGNLGYSPLPPIFGNQFTFKPLSDQKLGEPKKKDEQPTVQRKEINQAKTNAIVPASVGQTINSPGKPLDRATRSFMEARFGHDFGQVRIHDDAESAASARAVNASAYTVGSDIVFGRGQYSPNTQEGRKLLAHELTHVAQQGFAHASAFKPITSKSGNYIAKNWLGGATPPSVSRSTVRLARKVKKTVVTLDKGETVVSMRIVKNPPGSVSPSSIQVTTSKGRTFSYASTTDNLTVGSHTGKKVGKGLQVDVAESGFVLYFSGNDKSPNPSDLVFNPEFPVEVLEAKSGPPVSGGGKQSPDGGTGNSADSSTATGSQNPKGSDTGEKVVGDDKKADKGNEKKDGVKDGVKDGAQDGVKGGVKDGATQPIPDAVTELPKDFKGPAVTVSNPADVEKLKKLGLIPAKSADEIQAKLDKGETLSLEEVTTLMEGLNAVTEPPAKDSGPGKDSWLKWAKFVQENKDKISGKSKTGDKGMTVEEVKEIINKYKEFVGVTDLPKSEQGSKEKDFNPEKRKSWNSLQPWEKDLWKEYMKRHPGDPGVSEDTDLSITDSMKMIMALRASPAYVRGGGREALIQMVNDPIFISGTLVGITIYVASWMAPEPIFSKATAATITAALLTVFTVSEIKNFAVAWMNLSDESAKAKTIDEIETAAEHFGKQMGGILARVLVTITTMLAGKLLPGPPAASGGGGGGMSMGATAGGPPGMVVAIPQAVPVSGIKVLADGTILIITNVGVMATAATGGGGSAGGYPGPSKEPAGEAGKPKKEFSADEKAASKQLEDKMAAEKQTNALNKLAKEAPDLHKEVTTNTTKMADGKTTLKDLAQENPSLIKSMFERWKQGLASGDIKTKDFGQYVKSRQSEFRGRSGELEDAFTRGPKEILVKAPKANVNEPGTDSISYEPQTDRIKLLDNKSIKADASVSKVSALEKNLSQNLGDDIADIKKFAGDPGVPKEIGQKVLPRLEAAKAEIDAYVLTNKIPPEKLSSPSVQQEFAKILNKHNIDRVITFGGAGKGTGASGTLTGTKGFKTE